MKRPGDPSFGRLLVHYALPFWKNILLVMFLTLSSNLLAILNPVVMAVAVASFTGGGAAPPSTSSNPFDLNYLGTRVMRHWLLPFSDNVSILVLIVACAYLTLTLGVAALDYFASILTLKIRVYVSRLIQSDLLRHLLSLSLGFYHRQKVGEIMSRVTQDADKAGELGSVVRGLIHYSVQLIAYGVYLLSTSVWLSLGASGMILFHFLLTQVLKKPMRSRERRLYDEGANFSTGLQETLTSIRVAKSFGAESYELAKLKDHIHQVGAATLRQGRVKRVEGPARVVLDSVASIGIFLMAAAQLYAGSLTLQGLLLYVYVGRLIIVPINQLATHYLSIYPLLASFDRVSELFSEQPRVVDGRLRRHSFESKIELRNVSYSYGSRLALDNLTLEISKGEIVAVVGPSGAGKSTLADLILRLYDPDGGEILMDGVNLRELRQTEYRKLFGVVSQECLLFHDTVLNNIRYGRMELTEEAIHNAARIAHAHPFITGLPQGYHTLVGDRGVRLSGGERQRIAIARAVVHNPQILILDEATSALDSESERQVQMAIDQITKSMTALIIAHRLSTVSHADKIVVLDRGRILNMGRHGELLERCGLYRHLCDLQFGLGQVPTDGDGIAPEIGDRFPVMGLKAG